MSVILNRTFSRVVVIPFGKLQQQKGAVANSIELQGKLKDILPKLMKSIGVIIELHQDFATFQQDNVFKDVASVLEEVQGLDIRAKCNYTLLLYSTFKVRLTQ